MDRFHWTKEDLALLARTETCADMFTVAKRVLNRLPKPVVQVCGPISTGGAGSLKKNLALMDRAVELLHTHGRHVFSQLPFEEPMQRIKYAHQGSYAMTLLDDFYKPLFESGLVDALYFLPAWQSSFGARWEYEQAKRLGIKTLFFPKGWDGEVDSGAAVTVHHNIFPAFRPKFEIVSVFVEADGKFLLLHRQDHKPQGGTWGMPAGKIEKGETPHEAISRELREETGISAAPADFTHREFLFVRYPEYDFMYHIFTLPFAVRPAVDLNLNEHTRFDFFDVAAAQELPLIPGEDACIARTYLAP